MMTQTINGLIRIPGNKYTDHNIVNSYKGRQIDTGVPIYVYKNLHKKCYSVKQLGKVVAHAERLCISDAEFIVNEKQRQRVVETKQKNVHAFIRGLYSTSGMATTAKTNDLPVPITYNPYTMKRFTTKDFVPQFEVKGAVFAIADKNGVKAAYTYGF